MDLSNLKPAKGAVKKKIRKGRGQGSGKGGTATKGAKGDQSRSGYKTKPYFEGGQMPLQRRVPKRGFKNINRVEYKIFNLDRLQQILDKHNWKNLDPQTMYEAGLIRKNDRVKILGNGSLSAKVDVTVHAISKKAREVIEANGGTVNII